MDTIPKEVMKLNKLFQYVMTVALLVIGTTAFPQKAHTTRYDNGGKPIKGNYTIIGNRSDAGYNLNIPQTDPNCPVNIKWAGLYWGGHEGNNPNRVYLNVPGGARKTINKQDGYSENAPVSWEEADYLIYRFYFTPADGEDLDIAAAITAPVTNKAGYCRGRFGYPDMPMRENSITGNYALWSGDNTGTGMESILINVKKIKQDYPTNHTIKMDFYAGWFRNPAGKSANMAIKAEAYKGEMQLDPSDYYNWIPAAGATKIGEATFPVQLNKRNGACSNKWGYGDMYHFGEFVYDPADGRVLWNKASDAGGGSEYLGNSTSIDPTKLIVNERKTPAVNDDSYYYNYADVTADLQALAQAGNLNGTYKVDNVYNNNAGLTTWHLNSGWALVVVYEDPKLKATANGDSGYRVIRIQDGFKRVGSGQGDTFAKTFSGFIKPSSPNTWDQFGQVTLGGESSQRSDKFKLQGTDFSYNGRATDNFFNGTATIHNEAAQNTGGWDVSLFANNTRVAGGATSLNYEYNATTSGVGYDAYISIVDAVSVVVAQPIYELETLVKNNASANIAGTTVALGSEAKYEIRMRNVGTGIASAPVILEATLPANLSYQGIDGSLPLGATLVSGYPQQVGGRTVLRFSIPAANLPASATAALSAPIVLKVKATTDCGALRDACANKLDFQPKLIYNVTGPNATGLEQLSYSSLTTGAQQAGCTPSPTTFFLDDAPCGQASNNTIPYCSSLTLDGGAGYTSYKWTKQGSATVLSTTRTLNVTAQGVYVLERGGSTCNNVQTISFNITARTGATAQHPLQGNSHITESLTCSVDGLPYYQIALCGTSVNLQTVNIPSTIADNNVVWYKYIGTAIADADCPPEDPNNIATDGRWQRIGTGKNFTLPASQVSGNGTHFAIHVPYPSCPANYFFRSYKTELNTYTLDKENILPCATGGAKGNLFINGLPSTNYQYKVAGPSANVGWTNVPSQSFRHEVTQAGTYTVTIRPILSGGANIFQNNVCTFEQTVTVQAITSGASAFTLTKEDVKCKGNSASTGKLRVQVAPTVTLPVTINVKRKPAGTVVATYQVNTDARRDSNAANITALSTLTAGTYEVELVPAYLGGCSVISNEVTIAELPELKLLTTATELPACGPTKKISLTYTGGTAPYSVEVTGPASPSGQAISKTVAGINTTAYTMEIDDPAFTTGSKTYRVRIKDANGCFVERDVIYQIQEKPTFTATVLSQADCSPTNGSIQINLNNPAFTVASYQVRYAISKQNGGSWDPWVFQAHPNNTFRNLREGTYRMRVYYKIGNQECSYPEEPYTWATGSTTGPGYDNITAVINEGNGPIRAFAGVIQLACETPPASATIRVSNVSGGSTNTYEYSKDGGVNWQSSKDFTNVPPGSYNIKVRNTGGASSAACEWTGTVVVKGPIEKPTFTTSTTYDCDGIAQVTVTTTKGNYTYGVDYTTPTKPIGSLTTTFPSGETAGSVPKVTFPNIPNSAGPNQTIRVFYKETASPDFNVLIQEDFGTGKAACPPFQGVPANWGCGTPDNHVYINGYDNGYLDSNGCWRTPYDHTSGAGGNGRFAFYNIGNVAGSGSGGVLYFKDVQDVVPNQPIKYKLYLFNTVHTGCNIIQPNVEIRLVGGGGTVISSQSSGNIAPNTSRTDWREFSGELNPGANTSFRIEIRSIAVGFNGNDLAIDDIYVYQEPKACANSYVDITIPIEKTENRKFKPDTTTKVVTPVTCNGVADGKLKIGVLNYGTGYYRWRVLRGTTPVQTGRVNTPTLEVNNLAAGTYTLELTSEHQAKFSNNAACVVTEPFTIDDRPALQVVQNSTEVYMDCGVSQQVVTFFNGNQAAPNQAVFNITGGVILTPQTYVIKIQKTAPNAGSEETISPTVGLNATYQYIVTEGTYQLKITDTHGCNEQTRTFQVKRRARLNDLTFAYDNCATRSIIATATYATAPDYNVAVSYEWRRITGTGAPTAWSTAVTANNVAGSTTTSRTFNAPAGGWPVGRYEMRVTDPYSCQYVEEFEILAPVSPLTTADYSVVHPTNCGTPANGSITVNSVNGQPLRSTYRYAFKLSGQNPTDADYGTSATFTVPYTTVNVNYDVYIKDISVTPTPCGDKVTTGAGILVRGAQATQLPNPSANIIAYSATCEDGLGGKLSINNLTGRGPFEIIITGATALTVTIPNTTTFPYEIAGLNPGAHNIRIVDQGNNNCEALTATGYNFTIGTMAITIGTRTYDQPLGCGSTQMDFIYNGSSSTILPASAYRIVHRVARINGVATSLVTSPWQQTIPFRVTGDIGRRYVVSVGVQRISDGEIVCSKDDAEFTLLNETGINSMTAVNTANCSNMDITASFGATGTQYDSAQFFLNYNPANGYPAPAGVVQSGVYPTFTGSQSHTFTGVEKGRTHIVYVRYVQGGQTCVVQKELDYTANPGVTIPTTLADPLAVACQAGSSTPVNFTITLPSGGTPPYSYQIKIKQANGTLVNATGAGASGTLVVGANSITLAAQTIPTTGVDYVIAVTDSQVPACTTHTTDLHVVAPTNPMVVASTLALKANSDVAIGCNNQRGQFTLDMTGSGAVTGGVGPYTFSLLQADNAAILTRNIIVTVQNSGTGPAEPNFTLRSTDFLAGVLPTSTTAGTLAGATLVMRVTDLATRCSEQRTIPVNSLGKFAGSRHIAKFDLVIVPTATNCTAWASYPLQITLSNINPTGATPFAVTDYEYSLDNGLTYTAFTANPQNLTNIAAGFDFGKVRVRNRLTHCMANYGTTTTPTPSTHYIYPQLTFNAVKLQDMQTNNCTNYSGKIKVTVLSGSGTALPTGVPAATVPSGLQRYEIVVTTGGAVPPAGVVPGVSVIHNGDEIEITIPSTSTPPGNGDTYTVWVKDNGNAECNDFKNAAATITLKDALNGTTLPAAHTIGTAERATGCTVADAQGSVEFTRTLTPREEGTYTYKLYYLAGTGVGTPPGGVTAITGTPLSPAPTSFGDDLIVERTATQVKYKLTGLRRGWYRIAVTNSPNGNCEIDVTGAVGYIAVTAQDVLQEDAVLANARILQMGCATTPTIPNPAGGFITPSNNKAYLYIPVRGGTPPYTFEVTDGSGVVIATAQENPTVTPPAVPQAQHVFELPDRGANYTVRWKVTDAAGCNIVPAPGVTYTVNTLSKITNVAVRRTAQMSCNTTSTEDIELTVTRSNRGGNTNGYDVKVDRITSGGVVTPVIAYSTTTPPTAKIPGTGVGTISLPFVADDESDYTIEVKDLDTGCTFTIADSYRVTKTEKPTVTLTVNEGKCNNGSGGATLKFVVGVVGLQTGQTYDYNIYRGTSLTPIGTKTGLSGAQDEEEIPLTGFTAGAPETFRVVVKVTPTDCEAQATTEVTIPDPISAASAITRYMTYCGSQPNNDGEITVTQLATGGWGAPYQYRIVSNGVEGVWGTDITFTNLAVGTHYVQVRDVNGCIWSMTSYTFPGYTAATMQLAWAGTRNVVNPTCTASEDGSITISGVTGGTVPTTPPTTPTDVVYGYELFDAVTETSLGRVQGDDTGFTGQTTFTNLGPGVYFIRITSSLLCADDKLDTAAITVADPGSVLSRATLSTYPGCTTAGSITVVVEPRPNMLPARGTYTFALYDVTALSDGDPITSGTLVTSTPATISGTGPAEVTAVFNGDIPRPTATKRYQVLIKDAGGAVGACEGVSNIVEVAPVENITANIDANASTTLLNCYGSTSGTIRVIATGGKNDEPFVYTLTRVPALPTPMVNSTGVFEGLAAGNYTVVVSQAAGGCNPVTLTWTIDQEDEYKAFAEATQVTCNGNNDGTYTVRLFPAGTAGLNKKDGTPRKFYYAISPYLERFLDNDGKFENLRPGKYFVIMQDENGCRPTIVDETGVPTGDEIFEFTITEPQVLSASINSDATEHESCDGAADGKTQLRIFGGTKFVAPAATKPYKISVDGGAFVDYHPGDNGATPVVEPEWIENLSAGEHTIVVRDANGCESEPVKITIEGGSKISLTTRKIGVGDGYECINDASGVKKSLRYIVEAVISPETEALNVRFLLDGVAHDSARFELPVDEVNTRTFTITAIHKVANHGECRKDVVVQVDPQTRLRINQPITAESVTCHNSSDGAFELNASGGSGQYQYGIKQADGTYLWQDSNRFTGLAVGSYSAAVRDMRFDCIEEVTNIAIEAPDKITINQQAIKHVGCKGDADGEITYVFDGGTGPYSWEVFKEDGTSTSNRGSNVYRATNVVITGLTAGKYFIEVTDSKGCKETKNFEIIEGVDLNGIITQRYQCNADINANNTVLAVGATSTADAATYDVYVSVTTPYLVLDPSMRGAANRLRYAIGIRGGAVPTHRYQFDGTTPTGEDNTHNMYQIKYTTLLTQLNAAQTLVEGINEYTLYLYYFDKDNPSMSDNPICSSTRELRIEYYPPISITNQSIANDLNLLKVKVEGGKERYTVYFSSAEYHTPEEIKAHYVQRENDVRAGDEVVYYVQKTDYEEVNPATGNVEKKIRVYVEDSKGDLTPAEGGKEVCGHSVFLYKEFEDVVIPNFFTPNGDGQYDTWAPLNLASYPNAETRIYDRYGRHIATLNNRQEWDGTYGGQELPAGDYWYILELNEPDDSRTFKGHFTLYR